MGGLGSFLLFLANVLSILLASSVLFAIAGMRFRFEKLSLREIIRRYGIALCTFLLILIGFTVSLANTVRLRYVRNLVVKTLSAKLSEIPGTILSEHALDYEHDSLHVLATVRTPALIEPTTVEEIQNQLSIILNRNV
jgi:uncharacterized membrane protein